MSARGGVITSAGRWILPLVIALAAAGCGTLRGAPTERPGWLRYRAGALTVELPEDWRARGDASRVKAEPSGGGAQLRMERVERPFASEAECLQQGEQALARLGAGLERSRRHPTRVGGRPAVVQEGDSGAWHGWTWAACDGREQYRLYFVGVSPMPPAIFAAQRGVEGSMRFDGKP